MSISQVAVGEPVKATTLNQLIQHANGSPGRAIFTSNGTWSVPQGVFSFKVTLAGGGGSGGNPYHGPEGQLAYNGGDGGDSPVCSKIFGGVEQGTTFNIVIGAGAAAASASVGGTSTFGALLQSTGGGKGVDSTPYNFDLKQAKGSSGSHNGEIRHGPQTFLQSQERGYGAGGICSDTSALQAGANGICVIEW